MACLDYTEAMPEISASRFKERSLSSLDSPVPERMVLTEHGKHVATLTSGASSCATLIGSMKGRVQIVGDVMSTGVAWTAES
jgi:hypothetical protein